MKKLPSFLCLLVCACVLAAPSVHADPGAEAILQKEIGAFEITAEQRALAKDNEAGYPVLDAGRGNPNWINTQARYAFTRFMEYAVGECELETAAGDCLTGCVLKRKHKAAVFNHALQLYAAYGSCRRYVHRECVGLAQADAV